MVSDDLHKLIHSMNKREKIYFKRYALHGEKQGKNNYVKLYEAIANQKVYDEDAILKKFKDENFTKNFSVAKSYLYQVILRNLRNYYAGKNPEFEIRELLDRIDILFHKGLFKQCLKSIRRAEKLASRYELVNNLLLIMIRRIRLMKLNIEQLSHDEINEFFDRYLNLLEISKNYGHYNKFMTQLIEIENSIGFLNREDLNQQLQQLAQNSLLKDVNQARSFWARQVYYSFWGKYYSLHKNYEKLRENTGYTLQLIEQQTGIINEWPWLYLHFLYERLKYIYDDVEVINDILKKLHFLPARSPLLELTKTCVEYYGNFFLFFNTYDPGESKPDSDAILNFLKDNNERIKEEHQVGLFFLLALYHFTLNEFSNSLKILNELFSFEQFRKRRDLSRIASLLQIMNHFLLDNKDIVQQLSQNHVQKLKRESFKGIELQIFKSFHHLKGTSTHSDKAQIIKDIQMKMEEWSRVNPHPPHIFYKVILDWTHAFLKHINIPEWAMNKN